MNALLICPSEQKQIPFLALAKPIAAVPLLGQSLLEYWLSHLARMAVKRVLILASDRTAQIAALVQDGSRWGLEVAVRPTTVELTPAEALLKWAPELGAAPEKTLVTLLDHFPGSAEPRLSGAATEFFDALTAWMPNAVTPDRVGMHEVRAGVWTGAHSSISPDAHLEPPCWIGQHVMVGPGAVIGPQTIVEDGSFVEAFAEVSSSWIGEETLVGELTRIHGSLVWGNRLLDRKTGLVSVIPDRFVLSALSHPTHWRQTGWFSRLAERCRRNRDGTPIIWKELIRGKEAET